MPDKQPARLRHCPRCGAPLQSDQKTCAVCGLPLDQASVAAFRNLQLQQAQAILQPDQDAAGEESQSVTQIRTKRLASTTVRTPRQGTAETPTFHYSRPGFTFVVYSKRIEVTRGTVIRSPEVIPIRSISSVEVKGMVVRKLHVHTNDGRHHEFQLGTDNETAKEAILDLL